MWVIIPALALSIPIVAILTDFLGKQNKVKLQMLQDQLALEKIKHENFLLETEKMRLELEKMRIDAPKDKIL